MNKHICATTIGRDKAKATLTIEEFNRADVIL
jgi:hypothetical protein